MEPRTILFIGKPGCGKGTQAKLLAEKLGQPIMASGEGFRALAKEDTSVGHKVKETIESGLLMPDWFAMYLFQKSVFSLPENSGVIFDGFGRKLPEAELVANVLAWLGRKLEVVYINVSDEHILSRIEKRKGIEGRADDAHASKRLDEFRLFTAPCVEYFRAQGFVIEIDGEPDVETIHKDILKSLNIA